MNCYCCLLFVVKFGLLPAGRTKLQVSGVNQIQIFSPDVNKGLQYHKTPSSVSLADTCRQTDGRS